MNMPDTFPMTTPPKVPLFAAYADALASYEPDDRAALDTAPPHSIELASRLIGRGCRIAADGNEPAAAKQWRRAEDILMQGPQDVSNNVRSGLRAARLGLLARALPDRYDQAATDEHRKAMYATTIDILSILHKELWYNSRSVKPNDRFGTFIRLSGESTLALCMRVNHPWMTALPTLYHHNRTVNEADNKQRSTLWLTESTPQHGSPQTYRALVMGKCLRWCKPPGTKKVDEPPFDTSINGTAIVSAHCDLDTAPTIKKPQPSRQLSALLIAEALGGRGYTQYLDSYTNRILMAITSRGDAL